MITRFYSCPRLLPASRWNADPDAAYLRYTANETAGGVEFHAAPEAEGFRWWHKLEARSPATMPGAADGTQDR
ncbi:MAG TPA: hypothetical protein VMU78_05495 [Methylocella sp.]|nr:hypothetical protein [Methylocella sp.]